MKNLEISFGIGDNVLIEDFKEDAFDIFLEELNDKKKPFIKLQVKSGNDVLMNKNKITYAILKQLQKGE